MSNSAVSEIHRKILHRVIEGEPCSPSPPQDQIIREHVKLLKQTGYIEEVKDPADDSTEDVSLRITCMGKEYLKKLEERAGLKSRQTHISGNPRNDWKSVFKKALGLVIPLIMGALVRKLFSKRDDHGRYR